MKTQQIEKRIINQAAKSLIEAGYSVRVYDGEEFATEKTTDLATIMAEVFATEETYLYAYRGDAKAGFVWFVHGNGCDVMADNSTNLESVLQAASDLAETL
ncbi:hypothetical protein SAMN05216370_0126 [Pseudomonas peli]|uniref:Phage protein n=1 Tax=Pseudomonas peli TaxID=592361 RepID=A0AB37ZG03_9PSED|nr:hypothetical protein [Pseudomonas peli]NMZ71361.1 hypothetical protein [Pseudomonas peli]SCW90291.1 hypothetical protein SAMN05216370_0126 [Pseudomonas peli]